MCYHYIISFIQYFTGVPNIKTSVEKLEDHADIPSFSSSLRRKSSHHLDIDYQEEIAQSAELIEEDKENIQFNTNVTNISNISNISTLKKYPKKAYRTQQTAFMMIQIEKNIKIQCEYCKKELLRKQVVYRMMDKNFCSEYCRYYTFPQSHKASMLR
jgi:hypothetical protein